MGVHVTNVKEWMSGSPVSVGPEASALEAHDQMIEHGVRHLPVVDGEQRVVGVVSIDDLRAALPFSLSARAPLGAEQRRLAREWTVGDVMTHAPVTVQEGTSLREAAEKLAERRIGCLPVVDEAGRLAGIFSETDALNALATSLWSMELLEKRAIEGELALLVDSLRGERERLSARVESLHGVERELSADLHDEPRDAGDAGADLREIRLAETLDSLAARRLDGIDRALRRADQGLLGRCERCGGGIPVPRLRAMPGTTLCVSCARAVEEGAPAEPPFERPPGGRAETGRPELGARVHTRRFGEGVLLRRAPFGTCRRCGDVEGRLDPERDEAVCGREGCRQPLSDVREVAVVGLDEREAYVDPAELRVVDAAPYD